VRTPRDLCYPTGLRRCLRDPSLRIWHAELKDLDHSFRTLHAQICTVDAFGNISLTQDVTHSERGGVCTAVFMTMK